MSSPLHVHADFETKSIVDIKKCGSDVYARHVSTEVLCMAYAFDDQPVRIWKFGEPPPNDILTFVANGGTLIGHNVGGFEYLIWNYVCVPKYGWPPLKTEQLICTMAMSYAMALPGALANAAPAAGITHEKDMKGHRIMLQVSQPRSWIDCIYCEGFASNFCSACFDGKLPIWWTPKEHPEKFEKLYAYCMQDVEVERELYKRLLKLPPSERHLWQIDQRINQRGISIDIESVRTAIKIVEAERLRINQEIRRLTNNAVATYNANKQLTDWLKLQGVETDSVAKASVIELLLDANLPEDCRQVLLLRQEAAKSSTAKLQAMVNGVCEDGRMRGIFQYHGAATGRWAGRRVQPQNLPRPNLSQNEIEGVFEILGRTNVEL